MVSVFSDDNRTLGNIYSPGPVFSRFLEKVKRFLKTRPAAASDKPIIPVMTNGHSIADGQRNSNRIGMRAQQITGSFRIVAGLNRQFFTAFSAASSRLP